VGSSRENSLEIPHHNQELNPGLEEDSEINFAFIFQLSYHDPCHREDTQ